MSIFLMVPLLHAAEIKVGDQKVHHESLANGLDLVWIDDGKKSIDTYVVYAAGTAMESIREQAHMTEHAMFCTKEGGFDKVLQPYVKYSNAYTRREHTVYYNTAIALPNFQRVVQYEVARMSALVADEKCFSYEYKRLLQEVKSSKSVLQEIERERHKIVYGSGYGGISNRQDALQLADVQRFYQRWYQPKNAALVVVGAIGKKNWTALQKTLGKLKNRSNNKPLKAQPMEVKEVVLTHQLGREKSEWLWRGPDITQSDSWLYWHLLSRAYGLERRDSAEVFDFTASMQTSVLRLEVTGDNSKKRMLQAYKRLLQPAVSTKSWQQAKASFQGHLKRLPVRGRPYFSLAAHLGYWAAWDQLDDLPKLLHKSKKVRLKNPKEARWVGKKIKGMLFNAAMKGANTALPDDLKELHKAAELAQSSGQIGRAIACYEKLITKKPNRIHAVIYRYYLANLYLDLGDKQKAREYLLQGLKIVEYPALREMLTNLDNDKPLSRQAVKPGANTGNERLRFEGQVPKWAAGAGQVMSKIEKWRQAKFKEKVTVTFKAKAGHNAAGWYDSRIKKLVVGQEGSQRFAEGVMLHELYHALQDQLFGLANMEDKLITKDQFRAYRAVVEGEAMWAVAELMKYDFLAHAKYRKNMSKDRFRNLFEYGEGMRFVRAVHAKGGWEAVAQLYKEPPQSTAQILDPQRYLKGENRTQALPKKRALYWREQLISRESKGAYGFLLFLSQTVPEDADTLKSVYKEDQLLVIRKKGQLKNRWRIGLVSVEAAKQVFTVLEPKITGLQRKGQSLEWEW